MPLYSVVESTQRVYGVRLICVSARTNKRHHHHVTVAFSSSDRSCSCKVLCSAQHKTRHVSRGPFTRTDHLCTTHSGTHKLCSNCHPPPFLPSSPLFQLLARTAELEAEKAYALAELRQLHAEIRVLNSPHATTGGYTKAGSHRGGIPLKCRSSWERARLAGS